MANRKDDDQEMSMEEILASIRKYVTEDDPNAQKPQESASSSSVDHPPVPDEEEILDLANLQTVPHGHTSQPAANQAPLTQNNPYQSPTQTYTDDHDTHFLAPNNGQTNSAVDEPRAVTTPFQVSPIENTSQSPSPSHKTLSEAPMPKNEDDMTQTSFASNETRSATTSSLSKLMEKTKSLQQQAELALAPMISGGHTIESLAIHAMTPYIKEWLDANLPSLVERLVQNEIEKMTHELLQK